MNNQLTNTHSMKTRSKSSTTETITLNAPPPYNNLDNIGSTTSLPTTGNTPATTLVKEPATKDPSVVTRVDNKPIQYNSPTRYTNYIHYPANSNIHNTSTLDVGTRIDVRFNYIYGPFLLTQKKFYTGTIIQSPDHTSPFSYYVRFDDRDYLWIDLLKKVWRISENTNPSNKLTPSNKPTLTRPLKKPLPKINIPTDHKDHIDQPKFSLNTPIHHNGKT